MFTAGLMVAHLVAGKAVRGGLFLSRFPASDLPKIIAATAISAIVLGFGFARLLAHFGPFRLLPIAAASGALLHIAEFQLLRSGGDSLRGPLVVFIYLHIAGFGALLLSGFWSMANEVFDPREAKRTFGRIAGAGTIGGVCGGLLVERGAALFGVDALLLLLAALHLATAVALSRVSPESRVTTAPNKSAPVWAAAREAFRQAPFLVNLGLLVLFGTMSANFLDYLFQSSAAAQWGKGPTLTRYFAIFYTCNQIATFAVQTFATPVALRRLGLGRTVRWHPLAVIVGAAGSLVFPLVVMAPIARSLELILRGSFLRSGYELFFTPLPPREKRAVKTLIDAGFDRAGDALCAGVLQLLLLLGPTRAVMPILFATIAVAAAGVWITGKMDPAYASALEHGLVNRAIALNQTDVQDSTTLSAVLRTGRRIPKRPASEVPAPARSLPPPPRTQDAVLSRLGELRSGEPNRIAAALAPDQLFNPWLVAPSIELLAWDAAFEWARAFLVRYAHRSIGQLSDALLDPEQDFAVRRRIPHILAYTNSQRAVEALTGVLPDPRFEIRFNCSRALDFLHQMNESLHFDSHLVRAAVEHELSQSRAIWQGRKLLDPRSTKDSQYWFLDDVLQERADMTLEHIFSLLALELPREPLKVAFRALHGEDRLLRGLALEFLETHLSVNIVAQLRKVFEAAPASLAPRDRDQVLDELMASHQSILLNLKNSSAGAPEPGATQRKTRLT